MGVKQGASNSVSFIEPMLALRVPELPVGDWLYEVKFDGYRALAFKAGSDVKPRLSHLPTYLTRIARYFLMPCVRAH
jgi:hypothetical protein